MRKMIFRQSCLILITLCWHIAGQSQDRFRVERIRTIPDNLPILNIHVDDENVKWVANSRTLYKIEAKDMATEVPIAGGEVSLLQFPGGNADIRWNEEAMRKLLGPASITAAAYDRNKKILWIGTNGYGVFKFSVNPELKLIEQLHIDNSKLKSDFINSVYVGKSIIWIATGDGAVAVEGNQWTHHQSYFNIQRIRGSGNELWAIGDDLIWIIDRRGNWTPIAINRREIEGEIHDIAVDKEGRVWIASNIMTAYRIENDRYQRFGPGQYFTSQFVNFVAVDEDATIWVGTEDKGLYIIEKESTITVTYTVDKYLDCRGGSQDAALTVRAIGGKPPYQFSWEHGAAGDHLTGLGAGKYKLTVTDTEGSSKTEVVEIPDPFMTVTAKMDKPESGEGKSDGAASATVQGGVPPYTFEWFSGMGEASMTGLPEGEYGITITDAAGCSAVTTVAVSQIVQPLSVRLEQKAFIQCPGDAAAVITTHHQGGKSPLTYAWSDGATDPEFRENLTAGTYSVTVTDAAGNTATAEILIAEPVLLNVLIQIEKPASVNADDGAAKAQVTGGKAPYQYLWDNGEMLSAAVRLSARRHTLTVTDASGCTAVAAVDIAENILPLSASIIGKGDILCAGEASGSLEVNVQGGKPPFSFQWNHPELSGQQAAGLRAGAYRVTVTDAAGNTQTTEYLLQEPAPLLVSIKPDKAASANQDNGSATVQVTGGKQPYQYLWDNAETTKSAGKLSPATHHVTVTDGAGCTAVAVVNISENILPLHVTATRTGEIRCAGDKTAGLSIEVTGGKSPYAYQWNVAGASGAQIADLGAGDYSITVTDAAGTTGIAQATIPEPAPIQAITTAETPSTSGENEGHAVVRAEGGTGKLSYRWDNGDEGPKTVSLSPGLHHVTISDAAGCSIVAEVSIVEDFLPLSANLEQRSEIRCAGDATASVAAVVTGGQAPYTYTWDGGISAHEPEVNSLKAGQYHLLVTDASGNSIEKQITITEPAALQVKAEGVSPATANQSDGKAVVKVTGGVVPYQTSWSNGSREMEIGGLGAGTYVVTVTDAHGCMATAQVQVTEEVMPLQLTLEQTSPVLCWGGQDGAIAVSVGGGKAPYTYSWDDQSNSRERSGLAAGTYTVQVSDAAGQQATAQIVLSQPEQLKGEVTDIRAATHERIHDGKATAKVRGGLTPYSFAWDNGESTARAVALPVGMHTVTVTDANHCVITLTVEITEKILPELTAANLEKGEAVRMEKLLFEADSSSIDASSIPTLEELYQFLYDNPTIVVEIGGHTNGLPDHEYCDRLSTARAKAVADYIIQKGVDPKRILYKGYGKREPIATNMTPEGRRKNQRVEVRIVRLSD